MREENEVLENTEEVETKVSQNEAQTVDSELNESENKKVKKEKKHLQAIRLVEQAKQIVKEAQEQNEACKLLLAGDLKEYDEARKSLRAGGYDACTSLLMQLGYSHENTDTDDEHIVFEPKDDIEPIALKNVSSGRFTGVIYSLVAGAATAGGLIYLATEKLGITLDISKIPSQETLEKIATWFSTSVGLESNMYVGAGVIGLSSLVVMGLVYAIRVSLRGSKNLHFATKQLTEAEEYTMKKADCKSEMDKVDAHMKETVTLLKLYEIIFNEQKGKLERILHLEGSKDKSTEYHEKSFAEIRETKELLRTINDFISTPMSDAGKLSEKSVAYLERAKTQMDKMLERLY